MSEIFSLQWRIAVSWVSGYFIFYFFTPLIFMIYGPVVAGQFGLTFNMIRSLSTVSLSFITPKLPELSRLFAKEDFHNYNKNFLKYSLMSSVSSVILMTCLIIFILTLIELSIVEKNRFLSMYGLIMLCLIGVADIILNCLATYTRAQKIEAV